MASQSEHEGEIAEYVAALVADAPPLTLEQITRLRDLLPPAPRAAGAVRVPVQRRRELGEARCA